MFFNTIFFDHYYITFDEQALIMPAVKTPEQCMLSPRNAVTHECQCESYYTYGTSPLHALRRKVMRNSDHNIIDKYIVE
jgi:hypothetical protein